MSYIYGGGDNSREPLDGSNFYQHSASHYPNSARPSLANSHGDEENSPLPSPTTPASGSFMAAWPTPYGSTTSLHSLESYYPAAPSLLPRASYSVMPSAGASSHAYSSAGVEPAGSAVHAWTSEWSYAHPGNVQGGMPSGHYSSQSYPSPSYTIPTSVSPTLKSAPVPAALPPLSSPSVLGAASQYMPSRPPNNRTLSNNSVGSYYDSVYSSDLEGSSPNDDHAPKPFILKLYHLLSNPNDYSDVVSWDPPGTSFVVSHNDRLIRDVLPTLFGHGNIASFTRQLNVYNFTRLSTSELRSMLGQNETSDLSGWRHPLLVRGDELGLSKLKPRPSKARMVKKMEKAAKVAKEERETVASWQNHNGVGPVKGSPIAPPPAHYTLAHPYSR